MSLLYVIDGYNVIKRSGLFKNKPLREARTHFFSYIDRYRPQGSLRNRLVVVFDSKAEIFGYREDHDFEVIFTSGESADEKIKSIVNASADRKNIVVVTDDKDLARAVRGYGAKIMGTDEFLNKKARGGKGSADLPEADTKAELNIVQREAITEELKSIWLKKKSS